MPFYQKRGRPLRWAPPKGRTSAQAAQAASKLQQAARVLQGKRAKKASNVKTNTQLTRAVQTLKTKAHGDRQMGRHQVRWVGNLNQNPRYLSNIRPICFLHQAISEGSLLHTLELTPAGAGVPATLLPKTAGTWALQTLPVITQQNLLPADYDRFDQLQYWQQSGGVQNKFYHTSTRYTLRCQSVAARGFVDIFLCCPKRSFHRTTAKDVSLPLGLCGFTNMSVGCGDPYQINPDFWSCKRIKRHYFNCANQNNGNADYRTVQTNPDFDIDFTVTNKKSQQLIASTDIAQGGVVDYTDVAYRKQMWIVISTTLEESDVGAENHIKIDLKRSTKYRDYYGASV